MINKIGAQRHHFTSIDSTNAEAKRVYDDGAHGPLWITADEQTAGRGRLGRQWVSMPGNFYGTYLFTTTAPLHRAPEIGFVAAVAVFDAVAAICEIPNLKLKWPNDCLIGGAKFCGILPEVIGQGELCIALGCGINIAHAPSKTPYPVCHLGDYSSLFTSESIYQALALSMRKWLQIWNNGADFETVRAAWLQCAVGCNDMVSWRDQDGPKCGQFIDLAPNGALVVVLPDGTKTQIHSGEVSFAALEKIRLENV